METEREEKSISREHTFAEDEADVAVVRATLLDLAADVARRTRGRAASPRPARSSCMGDFDAHAPGGLPRPPDDFTFRETALRLFEREPLRGRRVRLIGFGVTGLSDSRVVQPGLFVAEADVVREKRERVSRALDAIRDKLDGGAIGFGGATRD